LAALPQEFELYGSRFRWFEGDAQGQFTGTCIPLFNMSQPMSPEAVIWHSRSEADQLWCGKCEAGFVYRFEKIGDFLVPSDGSFVRAFLNREAAAWAVDFVLCRGVIPRLLHLRGTTCLHAGAVAVGGCAVAFCGPSGSGKSSLTAAMATRGYRVLTDDVLPLRASSCGDAILAGPGLPEVRVHPSAATRLGIAHRVMPPVPGQTKAVWRPEAFTASSLPLSRIYLLEPHSEAGAETRMTTSPAPPRDALLALLFNSFWLDPGVTGALGTDLLRFAQVVRSLPISRLSFEFSEMGFDLVDRLISSHSGCR
jgi:hypothetical protein